MSEPRDNSYAEYAQLIDAYLDGAMSDSQREAFEERLENDPLLASELALQDHIDARISVLMAVPDMPRIPDSVAPSVPAPIPLANPASRKRSMPGWMRLAALLAITAIGVWAYIAHPWTLVLGPPASDLAADVRYRELVNGGLKPIWICENEQVFKKFTKDKFGIGFTIAPAPSVELVGWTYAASLLDSNASVLMCRVDGKPSIVVVGAISDDRTMHVTGGSGIRLHRKQWSGLVMYEMNERDDAPILDRVKAE